jgi:hypothetical protein
MPHGKNGVRSNVAIESTWRTMGDSSPGKRTRRSPMDEKRDDIGEEP